MTAERIARAERSLRGLALGDAFGDRFFLPGDEAEQAVAGRRIPEPPWEWTDDTAMAASVFAVLSAHGRIVQDELARDLADRYDPSRGYGPSMHRLLRAVAAGEPWEEAARSQFGGEGSHGNGAAMRVAPVGAWFADDPERAAAEAALSAQVTHTHPEAVAGAVAVALAAALAARGRGGRAPEGAEFLTGVARGVEASKVRSGLLRAARLAPAIDPRHAAAVLGNGTAMSAQDTVPFALWCAAGHLDDEVGALWTAVAGGGDRDTTCAIAGGVVAARTGGAGVPPAWLAACEPLPEWAFAAGGDGVRGWAGPGPSGRR